MTETATSETKPRAAAACAVVLAAAVTLGAVFLGAPPRFSAGESGPAWLRAFLTSLGPLSILEASAALCLGILVASECLRRESPGLPGGRAAARAHLPLVLLLAFGLVQLVPMPAALLETLAPFSARTYASLTATGDDAARPISLWPAGTAHALFNLAGVLAASAAVWTLVRGGAARRAATAVLVFVALVAVAESVHGLAATRLGDDRLLGTFAKVSGRGRVTGTFVHGTMMAVWAGMGACAALGLAAALAFDAGRRRLAPAAAAAAVISTAAGLFTLSRLGWIAVAAGVLATWTLLAGTLRRGGRRGAARAMGAASLVLALGAVAAVLSVPAFRERIGYLFTSRGVADPRFPAWGSTLALFRESPVVGTGLGSFGRAIHLTQSPDCPQELWFAHSDPLNLFSDAGVIGALLGAWWIAGMIRRGVPALRSTDAATRCLAAGALGAAVVVLVASLGDFQTQFPVVAIPFAALITLPAALADAATPAREADEPRPWILPPRALASLSILIAAAAAAVPIIATAGRLSDLAERGVTGATRAESLVARARQTLGDVATSPDPKAALAAAERDLREAARRDPLLDEAHLWTALTVLYLDQPRDDVMRALGRARLVARGHARTNLVAGRTYLDLIGTAPAPHGSPGDGAIAALREAGEIEPAAFSAAWAACVERGQPLEVLRAITPDRGYAACYLFDHLVSLGRPDEAIALLEDQLTREPWDEAVASRLAAALTEAGRSSEGRSFFDSVGAPWPAPR